MALKLKVNGNNFSEALKKWWGIPIYETLHDEEIDLIICEMKVAEGSMIYSR